MNTTEPTRDEPSIALFFKGFGVISLLAGILIVVIAMLGDGPGYMVGLALVMGSAPLSWWMGEIITLLDRIASRGEDPAQAKRRVHLDGSTSRI